MYPKKILVIGRHEIIMNKVVQMLTDEGYSSKGALADMDALECFSKDDFDAVIIGGGVELESRIWIKEEFTRINPFIKILDTHPSNLKEALKNALMHS